jgi:NTE family protein
LSDGNPKIGLVLGSGASRGWAHIGAIEALEEAGIKISMIAGASAGAFIGAAYAGGGLDKVKSFALNMDWRGVLAHLDIAFPRSGFIEGRKVAELIELYTQAVDFKDLKIPLTMIATDMYSAEQVLLNEGSITKALRASMGVPGVMTPSHLNGRWLVDGGVVNPLPVDVCRAMGAEIVVAVDINSERISSRPRKQRNPDWQNNLRETEKTRLEVVTSWIEKYGSVGKSMRTQIDKWFSSSESTPHIFDVMSSSLSIMQKRIEQMNLQAHPPDILIQPSLGDMSFFDFDEAEHAIDEGYHQAKVAIPELLAKISQK